MSRDADRLLAHGEMPARCVAKVGCRVADSEYVPEYVANRSMIDVSRPMRQTTAQIFRSSRRFYLRRKVKNQDLESRDFYYPTKV